MKAQVDVVRITPKKAAEYLENLLDGQRHVRQTSVQSMATDMREGRWRLSCDCLVLVNGKLGNGQHRLWAVVESDTSQDFILMRTDDEELYKVIDSGIKRTVGDIVHLPNGTQLAAVAMMVMSMRRGLITPFAVVSRGITRTEQVEFVQGNADELQTACQLVGRLQGSSQILMSKTVAVAFTYEARKAHGEKVDAFLLHTYTGDQPDSVCWELREKLLRLRSSSSRYPSGYVLGLVIKSFNAYLKGLKIRQSAMRLVEGEKYPMIAKA